MRAICLLIIAVLCAAPFVGCKKAPPPPPLVLKVSSTPVGAAVALDGKAVGKTPVQGNIPPGDHLLEISLTGYETEMKRFSGRNGEEQAFVFAMRPVAAPIQIESKPQGAVLTINGEDRGKTPVLIPQLSAGTYECTLDVTGFSPKKFRIVVTGRRPQRMVLDMDSVTCELEVRAATPKTEIVLNDKGYGATTDNREPLIIRNLVAGAYSLVASREGYKSQNQQLVLQRNEHHVVEIPVLEALPGRVEVVSTPPGADLFNGKNEFLGRTPCTVGGIQEGTLELTVRRKGYDDTTQSVRVVAGTAQKVEILLSRNLGDVELSTDPAGVTVLLDNQPYGKTEAGPLTCRDVAPGRHVLSLRHPDCEPLNIAVTVEKGKSTRAGLLKLKKRWKPTHTMTLKNGTVIRGVFYGAEPDGSQVFESAQGVKGSYKPSEIEAIAPLPK